MRDALSFSQRAAIGSLDMFLRHPALHQPTPVQPSFVYLCCDQSPRLYIGSTGDAAARTTTHNKAGPWPRRSRPGTRPLRRDHPLHTCQKQPTPITPGGTHHPTSRSPRQRHLPSPHPSCPPVYGQHHPPSPDPRALRPANTLATNRPDHVAIHPPSSQPEQQDQQQEPGINTGRYIRWCVGQLYAIIDASLTRQDIYKSLTTSMRTWAQRGWPNKVIGAAIRWAVKKRLSGAEKQWIKLFQQSWYKAKVWHRNHTPSNKVN
jgi:hypothetical protein